MDAARRAGETRPEACVNVVDLKSNGERSRMDTSPELACPKASRPVKWRCANCARPLGSAMAVCRHCEPEFTVSDPFRVRDRMHLPALHHCPACRAAFDVSDVRLEPEQAPWWRPQAYVYCCPACRLRLDWRPQTLMARSRDWAFFGLFALYVGMSMESWHYSRAWLWGLLALNGIAFCLALASSFGPQQQPGAGQLSKSGAAASSARGAGRAQHPSQPENPHLRLPVDAPCVLWADGAAAGFRALRQPVQTRAGDCSGRGAGHHVGLACRRHVRVAGGSRLGASVAAASSQAVGLVMKALFMKYGLPLIQPAPARGPAVLHRMHGFGWPLLIVGIRG